MGCRLGPPTLGNSIVAGVSELGIPRYPTMLDYGRGDCLPDSMSQGLWVGISMIFSFSPQ